MSSALAIGLGLLLVSCTQNPLPSAKVPPGTPSASLAARLAELEQSRVKPVVLGLPKAPLYVGSYARLPVTIDQRLDVPFDDIEFRVVEGPAGGLFSKSRDATFNRREPEAMLIAGFRPGKYTIEARHGPTDVLLAKGRFEVTVKAPAGRSGPSVVLQTPSRLPAVGSAWGGGPAGPQNTGTNSATGTRRIALIFVDTNEQRYTADVPTLDGFRQRWRENMVDGAMIDGIARSMRRFYQESSRNLFDISLQVFGPYQLDGNWDEVGAGAGFEAHAQAAITAADADIDYNNFDTTLVVSQSVGAVGAADAKYAWPTASIGEWGGWVTGEGSMTLGSIQMPNDWTERDGRQLYETASHEFGHNLGLGDQYTPSVSGRNPGAWELMDTEEGLPNFSLAHRLRLGWVDPSWVREFNFATAAAPVDETITLSPVALGAPPAGSHVGAEVRVTDGLNYYFEYRLTAAGQIADRAPPANDRILGTDVRSGSYSPPFSRPDILLLPNDSDGDGPVLGNGQDYRETDYSSPIYPVEFRADASAINGTTGTLRIRYGVNDKPDPSIRPWGAPPWQTPDIEVRNARNAADAAWFNVPWVGNPNQIIAKVKNNGDLDAPGVRVNFYVKDFNVGGAPETFLGSDTRNIAPGATVEFQGNWTPPTDGHYCVVVRIPLYTRPGPPAVTEMTELNNVAQSNYTRFISAAASPAERMISSLEVGNPYDQPTRVYLSAAQNNPLYRTYLQHKWLDLLPHESRKIAVMYEYAGEPAPTAKDQEQSRKFAKMPNRVQLTAYIVDPADTHKHHMLQLGGAESTVVTGKATRFERFDAKGKVVSGTVTTADGKPVPTGHVILTVTTGSGKDARIRNLTGRVENGEFVIPLEPQQGTVRGYYVPVDGYGDANSRTVTLD